MFRLTINGTPFECPAGTLLLQALQTAGASVPHLCHDDRLKPYAGCRLCLVEIDGEARPVASCAAEVRDGMVIRTEEDTGRALLIDHRYATPKYLDLFPSHWQIPRPGGGEDGEGPIQWME